MLIWSIHPLRLLVGAWRWERGKQRIPLVLGGLLKPFVTDEVRASVGGGIRFPFLNKDVQHPAFWFLYEKEVRRALADALHPGDSMIDVGAHRGFHSSYGLKLVGPAGQVIACEPFPQNADRLERLAELNPQGNLVVVRVAIAGTEGVMTLFTSDEEMLHSLEPTFPSVKDGPYGKVEVPTLTLDQILDLVPRGARGAIKIDAEGAERAILEAGERALASPMTMIVEVLGGDGQWQENAIRCVELLMAAHRTVLVLEPGGPRPWRPDDAQMQRNLLATPPSQ